MILKLKQSEFVVDVLDAAHSLNMTKIVLKVEPEHELQSNEAEVNPQSRGPLDFKLGRLLLVDPREQAYHGGTRYGKMQHKNVAKWIGESQALAAEFVQNTQPANYCVRVHDYCAQCTCKKLFATNRTIEIKER